MGLRELYQSKILCQPIEDVYYCDSILLSIIVFDKPFACRRQGALDDLQIGMKRSFDF